MAQLCEQTKSSSYATSSSSSNQSSEYSSTSGDMAGLRGLSYEEQEAMLTPEENLYGDEFYGQECESDSVEEEPESKDKNEGTTSYGGKNGRNSFGLGLKMNGDGVSAQLDGKCSQSWQVPTSLPGLFAEMTLSATETGKVSKNSAGDLVGSFSLTGEAAFTMNYGIPKLMSAYAGGKMMVKLDALKVRIDSEGEMHFDMPQVALKVALVVGAKIDVSFGGDYLQKGWVFTHSNKFEWNPGGEFELLKLGYVNGGWTVQKGADVERLEQGLEDLRAWAESLY